MNNTITATGYEALKEKLNQLKVRRSVLVKDMDLARQEGDLAENSAYHQLREDVVIITQRIDELTRKIDGAKIVEVSNGTTVGVGSKVVVEIAEKSRQFEIVGDGEADPLNGRISHQSPIGVKLMGKKAGDVVKIETPAGLTEYRVVKVG
ncbi:MAG: GreA/GreB family elongation factor [Patescibacteria group bacterium]